MQRCFVTRGPPSRVAGQTSPPRAPRSLVKLHHGYLGDGLGVGGARLQHLDLLVDVWRVEPAGSLAGPGACHDLPHRTAEEQITVSKHANDRNSLGMLI